MSDSRQFGSEAGPPGAPTVLAKQVLNMLNHHGGHPGVIEVTVAVIPT